MSDPQNLGLGELGQRVQAMSDPAPDPRLRPYQGTPVPISPTPGSRVAPPYESFEDLRVTPSQPAPSHPPTPQASSPQIHAVPPLAQPLPPQPAPYIPHVPYTSQTSDKAPYQAPHQAPYSAPTTAPEAPKANAAEAANMAPVDPNAPKSGLQRALDAVRSTLPLVQKLLPMLDGNFATAISSLVVPQLGHHPPAHPPQPPVNLQPIEQGLAELQAGHRDLRGQVQEQVTSLKRVEDQLERVREATDRNTLEQQELLEDLRTVGGRVSTFAIIGLVLLLLSLAVNAFFLFQLQHILR
ncbi:hypothetical protein [Acidicapsa ligni]|uniref:hypothetical protein n=1 Tax=Acidicapsa ligni TaxID=542300 RepID=UPI0021E0C972|nr:hypothetical protein [Acidicapsa ligni]